MMEFRKGDKVRVTATNERIDTICINDDKVIAGITGEIIHISTSPGLRNQVELSHGQIWWFYDEDLELVEEYETDKLIEEYETNKLIEEHESLLVGNSQVVMRTFGSGATRHTDVDKLDYEGFLSPLAIERYAKYLHKHRKQADGKLRDSDNWQKGIPRDAYIKSAWRHLMAWWRRHRGHETQEEIEDDICAVIFNTMGYLHELLKEKTNEKETDIR